MFRSKNYRAAAEKIDANKLYTIEEAAALVKETSTVKFDATIDVSFKLNVDPKQADQQVRGTLILPHGNGKTKKVLAITDKVDDALAAGADFAGGNELLDKIQKENWFDFDVIVATPNMMGNIGNPRPWQRQSWRWPRLPSPRSRLSAHSGWRCSWHRSSRAVTMVV